MLKKIAIVLSAATIVNFSAQPLKVLASQVADNKLPVTLQSNVQESDKAIVNSFDLYGKSELSEYDKVFKMDTSNIESISNNGGKYGSSDINKAIDGKLDTHWETGKPNSGSFTNEVNIKLKEATTLNRIVYATRQDGAKGKGFPNEFEIYSSKTDSGNDFTLVSKGSHTTTGNLVEIQFKPTEFKRIKFVFKKASENWASASELWFYKEDKLPDTIDKLFTDNLKTDLSNEYKSKEKIDELAKLAENHPLKSQYRTSINQAKSLIENPTLSDKYKKGVITLEQLGFSDTDAWTNKGQCFQLSNLLPTGLYYTPGEQFVIDVEAENGKLPKIKFDQNYDIKSSNEQNTFILKPGRNIIIAPKNTNGGGIFFENNYLPSQQKVAPKISIKTGGNPYPIFYEGVTNVNEFKETLKNYKQKMSESNKDGKIIVPNLVTIVTEHSMVNSLATVAYNTYVNKGQNPQATANAWEQLMLLDYEMLGYTKDAENIKHRTPTNRLLARAVKSGLYSAGGYIGIEYPDVLLATGVNGFGWAIYHEIGHALEMNKLKYGELTNNLFSLMNQEKTGQSIRVETNANFTELWDKYTSGKTMGFGYQSRPNAEVKIGGWVAHLELWQLRIAFGEKVFTDIFTLARNTPAINGANSSDNWARFASEVTGYNLGEYLYRMGLNIHKETLDYTSKFKKLDRAIQYADTNARLYKGNGFKEGYVSEIASVKKSSDGNLITIDSNAIKGDLMGFEVYRNNKLIGYTNKASFTDKNSTNELTEYKIVAYDRKLKAAKESETIKFEAEKPNIYIDIPLNIALGEKYDPLEGVRAEDSSGNNIIKNITVLEDNVNVDKAGKYTIRYKVEDNKKNSTEKIREVNVFENTQSLVSLNWKSATSGWKSVQKNKNLNGGTITLLDKNNNKVQYQEGLGTFANSPTVSSAITYDIKDKGYKAFTSYVGVDLQLANNTPASVTFEVYIDGKKVYNSGLMKSNIPQKLISVSLEGASELKLVVTDAGNGYSYDYADWANPRLYK